MTIYKPYTEATAEDFRQLFRARFPGGDEDILRAVLANPARAADYDAGSLALDEEGKVKAIHGLFPRVVYYGSERLKATSGVALAVRKDANRDFFTDFVRDSILASGADIFLANTAIPGSRRRGVAALGMMDGPDACAFIRERSLGGWARAKARLFRRAWTRRSAWTLSREKEILSADFDGFWARYLVGHTGLVSSRTAEELRWMFASGLSKGDVWLVTARRSGELGGYAFCRRTDETSVCWRVVDMIARDNDEQILTALIEAASAFLCRETPATCLQITGFPAWVQPLLRRLFPTEASFGFNKCVWAYLDERARRLCGDWVKAKDGWYGCPYDGDMCLV